MKVFVTGATGFVGSAVVRDLLAAGHEVTGLARSDDAAARVAAAGAGVHRGSLADPGSLRAGAAGADGVIHTAYIHDFSPTGDPVAAARTDARAIEALGSALAGSGRPLVVATGAALLGPGKPATEDDDLPGDPLHPRLSEQKALPLAGQDVRVSVVRLPPSVHGEGDYAFVPFMIGIARATGRAAYVGDGANRWAAVHRVDAARLFRVGLESAQAGSRLHAVGDEGVPFREIARVISLHLKIRLVSVTADEAPGQFGGLAHFAAADLPATAALTRERFGWRPVQPGLIADLDTGHYFAVA